MKLYGGAAVATAKFLRVVSRVSSYQIMKEGENANVVMATRKPIVTEKVMIAHATAGRRIMPNGRMNILNNDSSVYVPLNKAIRWKAFFLEGMTAGAAEDSDL